MTAKEARLEIEREQVLLADLARRTEVAEAEYKTEAMKPRVNVGPLNDRFDEAAVSRARSRVAALRAQHETVTLRIETLRAQLPTAEQAREGRGNAERLIAQVAELRERSTDAQHRFMAAVQALEVAARELVVARDAEQQIHSQAYALVERFDLDVPLPSTLAPHPHDQRVVGLVLALAQQARAGAISPQTESALADARAECTPETAAG